MAPIALTVGAMSAVRGAMHRCRPQSLVRFCWWWPTSSGGGSGGGGGAVSASGRVVARASEAVAGLLVVALLAGAVFPLVTVWVVEIAGVVPFAGASAVFLRRRLPDRSPALRRRCLRRKRLIQPLRLVPQDRRMALNL
jgi:hypothetical protein